MYSPKFKLMHKRGQIVEFGLILVILGIAVYGTSTMYMQKENTYVGDSLNSRAYRYADCKEYINSIPIERLTIFPSYETVPTSYNVSGCP